MNELGGDLVGAVRVLRRRPAFTALAVGILGLGIGVVTTMFSVVHGVLLEPLPFPAPDDLVVVREYDTGSGTESLIAPPTLVEWREARTIAVSGYTEGDRNLTGGGEPERVRVAAVNHELPAMLGAEPALGRGFVPEDDVAGAAPVAMLGHALWQRRYGGDGGVLGERIVLDGTAYEVVGVAPAGFDEPEGTQIWTPLMPEIADALGVRGARFLGALGRLAPDVTADRAEAELTALYDGGVASSRRARLVSLREHRTGAVRPALVILLAAVILVLLIACANVGGLLLTHTVSRRHELAIRSALGAGRRRIVRQLLAESLVIGVTAGAVGVLLAVWGLDLVIALSPDAIPRAAELSVNGTVLAFAVVASIGSGVLAGLLPAARSGVVPAAALREGGSRLAGGIRGNRLRAGLVVLEVALSVVLLVGATLLLRSFVSVITVDPGFRAERVTTISLNPAGERYGSAGRQRAFYRELLERVRALPGVSAASLTRNLPLSGRSMTAPVRVEGGVEPEGGGPAVQTVVVGPDYFRTMGIELVRGRAFTEADDGDAPSVAVVDEAFARRYFDGADPTGRRARSLLSSETAEIVGVARSVHHSGLADATPPAFYRPFAQDPTPWATLVVRADMPAPALASAVKSVVLAMDAEQPIGDVATMRDLIERDVAQPRFYAALLGAFAVIALLLAMAGFYAVMSTAVAQRRHEIGIRIALGARVRDVLRLVARQGLLLAGAGLVLGVAGALALSRLLEGLLFGVRATDPLTFLTMAAVTALTAFLATWIPARRAARVDPVDALRE